MKKRKVNKVLLFLELIIMIVLLLRLFINKQDSIIEVDHPYFSICNVNSKVDVSISEEQLKEIVKMSDDFGLRKIYTMKKMTKDDFDWEYLIAARWSESDQIKMNYDILIGEKKSYICFYDMFLNPNQQGNSSYIRVYTIKDNLLFFEMVMEMIK